jgi:hypothetical protein
LKSEKLVFILNSEWHLISGMHWYGVTLGDAGNDVEHRGFCEEHRGLSSLPSPLYGSIPHTFQPFQ